MSDTPKTVEIMLHAHDREWASAESKCRSMERENARLHKELYKIKMWAESVEKHLADDPHPCEGGSYMSLELRRDYRCLFRNHKHTDGH